MIDLHSHILYGMDDGPQTLEESLALGRMAATEGITVIAATPHSPASLASRVYDADLIVERSAEIEEHLQREGIALRVVPGTEIAFDAKAVDALRHGLILPYHNTHTLLLEPTYGFPAAFDSVVFALQASGYRVLLAHPERVADVHANPYRLVPLIERGVLMQLTAEALTGQQGDRMRRVAETLLTHNLVHVIASDAHRVGPRLSALGPAHARAAALVGERVAAMLVETNPAAILANQPVQIMPPKPLQPRFPRFRW